MEVIFFSIDVLKIVLLFLVLTGITGGILYSWVGAGYLIITFRDEQKPIIKHTESDIESMCATFIHTTVTIVLALLGPISLIFLFVFDKIRHKINSKNTET